MREYQGLPSVSTSVVLQRDCETKLYRTLRDRCLGLRGCLPFCVHQGCVEVLPSPYYIRVGRDEPHLGHLVHVSTFNVHFVVALNWPSANIHLLTEHAQINATVAHVFKSLEVGTRVTFIIHKRKYI